MLRLRLTMAMLRRRLIMAGSRQSPIRWFRLRVLRGLILCAWSTVVAAGGPVYSYVSWAPEAGQSLTSLVRHRGGRVLARYQVDASLIGEHPGTRLVLIEWPDTSAAFQFLNASAVKSDRRFIQFGMGTPFTVSSHNTPSGDFVVDTAATYLIGAFALAPGARFKACRDQTQDVLDLAAQQGGELVASYRITSVLLGELQPVLFGILRWQDADRYASFKTRLFARSVGHNMQGHNRAHRLRAGEVLLLEARALR